MLDTPKLFHCNLAVIMEVNLRQHVRSHGFPGDPTRHAPQCASTTLAAGLSAPAISALHAGTESSHCKQARTKSPHLQNAGLMRAPSVQSQLRSDKSRREKCRPLDEVGDEVGEALVVGDDLPEGVDVGGHRHGREHPPLPPRHHVDVALDAARRRGGPGLRRARASSVVVLVVGAPVVPCGGRGRGGDGAPGRGPRERGRRGTESPARARARARDPREEGGGGRGESSHRSCARVERESVLAHWESCRGRRRRRAW